MVNSLTQDAAAKIIASQQAFLGIELGSTRIKAHLIDETGRVLAGGAHGWENSFEKGYWTYPLQEVWDGIQHCYASLASQVEQRYGIALEGFAAGGFSAMMHGYLAFDAEGELLTPFRTWRNNCTAEACRELSPLLGFAIPQRWSIAHLHQAILNGEEHISRISFITTLAGYVHWKLTGEKVIGVGDASGMFPIDPQTKTYDQAMIDRYQSHIEKRNLPWKLADILPEVLVAGQEAGTLSPDGVARLDASGKLAAGIPLCPPEGDAGTGMVATNSVSPRTGNVSVGTSVFAMVVLEGSLSKVHEEIDIVTTPDGSPVAMAHSNNGSGDLDAWMQLFSQSAKALGVECDGAELYGKLMPLALEADADAGGLTSIGYLSGEHITGFSQGRPLLLRGTKSSFTPGNLLRSVLFSMFCALRTGLNILTQEEGVHIDQLRGHGGLFNTPEVGQRILAAATGVSVSLPASAGEGGSWGMALLAAYMKAESTMDLGTFLDDLISSEMGESLSPMPSDEAGFGAFFQRYHAALEAERAAIEALD